MKTIKIKNKYLGTVYSVLNAIKVEGYKVKRGKGNLQNRLKDKIQEYHDDLTQINENYFQKDERGEFKQEGESLIWLDKYRDDYSKQKEAQKAIEELLEEEAIINLVEHETKIKTFYEALTDDKFSADEDMKDDDFETMVIILEEVFENKGEKENE